MVLLLLLLLLLLLFKSAYFLVCMVGWKCGTPKDVIEVWLQTSAGHPEVAGHS